MSKGYLWQLENGKDTNPSLAVLSQIAVALESTIAELLDQPVTQAKPQDEIPAGLKKLLEVKRRQGEPVPEDIALALAQLRARGEVDWEFLYRLLRTQVKD
jgi:transcriptional regulator with XRE-family HTH domain